MMKRVVRLFAFFVVTMTLGVSGAFAYLCWLQASSFVNVPDRPHQMTPSDFGIETYQDVVVTTEDDVTIRGWYIPPTRDDGATFIFLHGHGGNILDLMLEAQLYVEMGYGAILFDFRGRGLSDDAPVTMGINEVQDTVAILDFLLAQAEVNPERIALYGNSMGASTAILVASEYPQIRLVIADAP
ncbi:MAG: alpha/beta fold hydrolase, partial [Chloroflexota bacterium]